jgi:hypothetical protein
MLRQRRAASGRAGRRGRGAGGMGGRLRVHSVHRAAVVLTLINTRPFCWVFYRTQAHRESRSSLGAAGAGGGPGYPAASVQAETQHGRVTQTWPGQDSDSDSCH